MRCGCLGLINLDSRAVTAMKKESNFACRLDLYAQVRRHKRIRDDETNPLISILRLSGITRVVEGLLYVRNRIYYRVFDREWVLANMPDAELHRQRAAYRRGLLRATAVATLILLTMAILSFVAIRQRNRANQLAQETQVMLQEANRQRQLIEEQRQETGRHRTAAEVRQLENEMLKQNTARFTRNGYTPLSEVARFQVRLVKINVIPPPIGNLRKTY
jgi:hypothetical protein